MVNPHRNFLSMVFLITLPKMIARTKKWAVRMRLDASYNLCSKLGSKLIFGRSYGSFSFTVKVPDHFTILSAFSIGGCF
jgi:hypothetical protein